MGYDSREKLAYEVAKFSILQRTNDKEVNIIPIDRFTTKSILKRPVRIEGYQLYDEISSAPMSTDFAIARFCVPFLQNEGWALFIDSDIICLEDIRKLFSLVDDKYAVMCVKHSHIPKSDEKFHDAGMIQTTYEKKNWSSCILFNCSHPANKNLTLEKLNTWRGLDLHQFKWLQESEIGELNQEWNFLVEVNEGNLEEQKILHYTNGQPGWGEKWIPHPTDYMWNKEYQNYREQYYGVAL
jgi:lipopolysaccharide biosynthesis glycosyltransferase